MKTIEEVIDNIVDEHKECRWLDAGELQEYLEEVATEQKKIDIDKACIWLNENARHLLSAEMRREFRKAMEE